MIRKLNDNIKDLYHLFKEAVHQFRAADPYDGKPLRPGVQYRGDGYTFTCSNRFAGQILEKKPQKYDGMRFEHRSYDPKLDPKSDKYEASV